MKLAATVARVVASLVGALVLVPLGLLVLMETGVAGAWRWLPGCVVLVAGLAGCSALALWWPRQRMRVGAVLAALVWGTVATSAAYWPGVTTRAEVREAFERVDYHAGFGDPTIWELGGDWCAPGSTHPLGCPRLTADYLVDEGGSEDVLEALEDAGFVRVGEAGPLPVEDFDLPLSGSVGEGTRYWLMDGRLRVEVTVVSDRMLASPLQGTLGGSIQVPTSTEEVSLELFDADNPHRLLDDITELGFWSPDASLEDLEPPPGW